MGKLSSRSTTGSSTTNRGQVTVAEVDLRVGGKWRFAMVTDSGVEVGFHGEFREVVPNERIVSFPHINFGMEAGLQDALDLLEEVAISLS